MTPKLQLGDHLKKEMISKATNISQNFFESDEWSNLCGEYGSLDGFHWDHFSSESNSPIYSVAKILGKLGYSCDPTLYEEPYMGRRMFPLSLEGYAEDFPITIRIAFMIWLSKFKNLVDYYQSRYQQNYIIIASVMTDLFDLTVSIFRNFGSREEKKYRNLHDLEENFVELICAHECFGLDSDTPMDSDFATLEFFKSMLSVSRL